MRGGARIVLRVAGTRETTEVAAAAVESESRTSSGVGSELSAPTLSPGNPGLPGAILEGTFSAQQSLGAARYLNVLLKRPNWIDCETSSASFWELSLARSSRAA